MWNSISGLDAWYHFRFNISCGVDVTVRSHQQQFQVISGEGKGTNKSEDDLRNGDAIKNED